MGTVGSVTVGVKGDSTEFRADMVANQKIVANFAQQAQQAGQQAAAGMASAGEGAAILSQGLATSTAAAGALTGAMTVLKAAISTAFPVFGALALLDVLEKIADNKFAQMATKIGDGFQSMNLSMESSADALKESTARMQEQLDILSGKRPNLLAEQLADASIEADKLASKLDEDNRKIEQLLTREHISAFQGLITGRAGTADVEGSINSFNQQIAHLANVYQHDVRTGSGDSDKALKELTDKRNAAQAYADSQIALRKDPANSNLNQDANISALTGYRDTLTDVSDYVQSEKDNKDTAVKLKTVQDQNKADAMQREAERKAADAQRKAQQELLRQDQEAEKQQNAFNKLTITEEIDFWNERLAAFVKGSEQYIQVQDRIYDLIAKRPDLTKTNRKNQALAGKSEVEGDNLLGRGADALQKMQEQQYDSLNEARRKYNQTTEKGYEAEEKSKTAFAETQIQLGLLQGTMSNAEAAQALATAHAHDHVVQLDLINRALAEQISLIKQIPDDKMSPALKDKAIQNANAQADNRRTVENGAYQSTQARDNQSIASQGIAVGMQQGLGRMVEDWKDMTKSIVAIMTRGIDSLNGDIAKALTGHGSKQDFGKTLSNAGEGLVKTGLQAAEGWGISKLTHGKIGGKADGSQNNPYHVVIAGATGTSTGSGASDAISAIAGPAMSKIGGTEGILGGFLGSAGGFLSKLIPHFASGGNFLGGPMLVGENGPEIVTPGGAGSVIPNDMLGGGGNHFHIDARGSSDPAAVHAAIMRAAPHIAASAVQAQHSMAKRMPRGR